MSEESSYEEAYLLFKEHAESIADSGEMTHARAIVLLSKAYQHLVDLCTEYGVPASRETVEKMILGAGALRYLNREFPPSEEDVLMSNGGEA